MKFNLVGAAITIVAMAGCVNYVPIALESGPEAEEAVQHLYSEDSLMQVIAAGKDQKVRKIAAQRLVRQINDKWTLCRVIREEAYEEYPVLREAALERLMKMPDGMSQLKEIARAVATGRVKKNGKVANFPAEYRIKAIQNGAIDREVLSYLAVSKSEDVSIRKAALKKLDYSSALAVILDDAADESSPSRDASMDVAKSQTLTERENHKLADVIEADHNNDKASLRARKLAFSLIGTNEDKAYALSRAIVSATGRKKEDDVEIAKYVITQITDQKILRDFVLKHRYGSDWRSDVEFVILAVKQINDTEILRQILDTEYILEDAPSVAMAAVDMIQDAKVKKELRDVIVARCDADAKNRGAAIARIYHADPKKAYQIVYHCLAEGEGKDYINEVTDVKTLVGLLRLCKEDEYQNRKWSNVVSGIKNGLWAYVNRQFEAMPKDKVEQLVKAQVSRAEKLAAEGKTLVVGNCYVGMRLIDLRALNSSQEFMVKTSDWEVDAGDTVVVTSLSVSSKDLFKATGLEQADVLFKFPSKFKVSPFEFGATDVRYERNYGAELFYGDYSQGKVTGGDSYLESKTQAKNVKVLFWNKSGLMEISRLND